MKAERSSRTALMVTYARAAADVGASHVRDFRDPTARVFLSEKGLKRLAKTEELIRTGRETVRLSFARVSADLMALRTSTIDAAVRAAVSQGNRQIVILGAGLDGRAWRMPELAGLRVFEVDHPATQGFKRLRIGALPASRASVVFVSIDFEHELLDAALARAGHDDAQPTCWIWEGVVMYLSPEVVRSTLASIAGRSAKGSTLIVNYHTTMRTGLVRLIFRLLGEPVKSKWSPEEMAAALRAAGFGVIEDSGLADWAKRFATGTVNVGPGRMMRIVVAQRS
ncbi:MAG TPA: class I SAM-dependent methyltransferase [Gemmatimonadaceae bacterium]|nr:class I SAM-dependent methyltransferase [Gemmatimonadaceae bacterium]